MKCANIQQHCMELAGEPLPPAIAEHVQNCAACKAVYEKTLLLTKLISLKQYEKPDAAIEARCCAMLQTRIDAAEENRGGLFHIFDAPSAVFRYVLAAFVLGFLGIHMLTMENVSPLPSVAWENQSRVIAESDNTSIDPRDAVFQVASNSGPGRIQYGTGPSRTVDYEY